MFHSLPEMALTDREGYAQMWLRGSFWSSLNVMKIMICAKGLLTAVSGNATYLFTCAGHPCRGIVYESVGPKRQCVGGMRSEVGRFVP